MVFELFSVGAPFNSEGFETIGSTSAAVTTPGVTVTPVQTDAPIVAPVAATNPVTNPVTTPSNIVAKMSATTVPVSVPVNPIITGPGNGSGSGPTVSPHTVTANVPLNPPITGALTLSANEAVTEQPQPMPMITLGDLISSFTEPLSPECAAVFSPYLNESGFTQRLNDAMEQMAVDKAALLNFLSSEFSENPTCVSELYSKLQIVPETFTNYADSEDFDAEDGEDAEDAEDGADPEQNIVEDEDEESNNNNGGIFDFFSKEGFSDYNNNNEFSVRNNSVLKMDLLLRSVLYACLFYLLAHPDTLSSVVKNVPGVKKANSLLVMMGVFFLVYYILNLFI